MKRFHFLFGAMIVFVACNNKKKEVIHPYTDLFRSNLKGEVHFLQDSVFVIDTAGEIVPDPVVSRNDEYKLGYLDKRLSVDTGGSTIDSTLYFHYDNGLLKNREEYAGGRSRYSLIMHIDSSGRYISGESTDSAGHITLYRNLTQNEYGQLTSARLYDEDSLLKSSFSDRYEECHLLEHTMLDSAGRLAMKVTYKINDKGDPVEETVVSKIQRDSTRFKKYSYDTYDKVGNWIQRTEWNRMGRPVGMVVRKLIYKP